MADEHIWHRTYAITYAITCASRSPFATLEACWRDRLKLVRRLILRRLKGGPCLDFPLVVAGRRVWYAGGNSLRRVLMRRATVSGFRWVQFPKTSAYDRFGNSMPSLLGTYTGRLPGGAGNRGYANIDSPTQETLSVAASTAPQWPILEVGAN